MNVLDMIRNPAAFDVRGMQPRNSLGEQQGAPDRTPMTPQAYNVLAKYGGPTREAASALRGDMGDYANAIGTIESSNRYDALGPVVKNGGMYDGDRAYGRYQVMGRNIPEWTRTALGQEMTPEQFLASPEAQDAVFQHYFGRAVSRYGNPQDAASVWFSGQPLERARGRSDGYTEVGEYVRRFNAALSAEQHAAIFGD